VTEPPAADARAVLEEAARLVDGVRGALAEERSRRAAAHAAYQAARADLVERELARMPVARLRETTEGRVRLGPIETAGVRTVADVLAAGPARLERIPGVGELSATRIVAAARRLRAAMAEAVRLRLNPVEQSASQSRLLQGLRLHEAALSATQGLEADLVVLEQAIEPLRTTARPSARRLRMLFSGRRRREEVRTALAELAARLAEPEVETIRRRLDDAEQALGRALDTSPAGLWEDFRQRAVAYNGLLVEIAGAVGDEEAVRGYLPSELAEEINAEPLDTSQLRVRLRGYQAFGAKFALAQRRAILGDEMGLGKTVEALAAMAHLSSAGETHFLVVCPASVVVNWEHETVRHSALRAHRVHGHDRAVAVRRWAERGGVAITTYETLRALVRPVGLRPSLLIVDEAHYVKNPESLRTRTTLDWIASSDRALFLTGTPMENRVEEFRTLVGHLRPDLARQVRAADGLAGAVAFRRAVAPVYLRRNQSDVLDELPPRIETEDWVELTSDDSAAYHDAVVSGNFMAMRRAPFMAGPGRSAKLTRLAEIVDEAIADGRSTIVFSYFRTVLDVVASALGDQVAGRIAGDVAPAERQRLVTALGDSGAPGVLVAQIEAGGVGLNIQAASVVILTEPQWKPSAEEQAIARSHRLGQAERVNVHRLLAAESVDARMLDVLSGKRTLFDAYAKRSDLSEASPDAVDVSELPTVVEVVNQAEAERAIVDAERRRLGIVPPLGPT